mmetsp:Transcript_144505/g.402615  ORF Transcript_144505/g.402615 Transcript_144505/m.402615 type:complete len:223 (+) Transcript_144505:501-1169(+)
MCPYGIARASRPYWKPCSTAIGGTPPGWGTSADAPANGFTNIGSLSAGQRLRVCIACTLPCLNEPLQSPTMSAPLMRALVVSAIGRLAAMGTPVQAGPSRVPAPRQGGPAPLRVVVGRFLRESRTRCISSVEWAKAQVSAVYLQTPCKWYMQNFTFWLGFFARLRASLAPLTARIEKAFAANSRCSQYAFSCSIRFHSAFSCISCCSGLARLSSHLSFFFLY